MMYYRYIYQSYIGPISLFTTQDKVMYVGFDKEYINGEACKILKNSSEISMMKQVVHWLDVYFDGKNPGQVPDYAFKGSSFQKIVWNILAKIPYGQVVTYGDIAKEVAKKTGKAKMSAQAVGGAVGKNPISILIPCHRVVGSRGNLTGYGWGLDKKYQLLKLEGLDMEEFSYPTKKVKKNHKTK